MTQLSLVTNRIAGPSTLVALCLALLVSPAPAQRAPSAGEAAVNTVSVSAGEPFACAVIANDTPVQCWGTASDGVLGARRTMSRTPVPIALHGRDRTDTVVGVSAGATTFACALFKSGDASCWGLNLEGEIGDGTSGNRRAPTHVRVPAPLTSLHAGENVACGLSVDGRAWCWGVNSDGQLGAGDSAQHRLPIAVNTSLRFRTLSVGAAGGTCGITMDHRLACWGRNDGGQLGTGNDTSVVTPRIASLVASSRFDAVSVGNAFACGITTQGRVRCWGTIPEIVGAGTPQRVTVVDLPTPAGETFTGISAGFRSACALTATHHVYCWGGNGGGQLARAGSARADNSLGAITSSESYLSVSVGGSAACAITGTHALDCWGADSHKWGKGTPTGNVARIERISFDAGR